MVLDSQYTHITGTAAGTTVIKSDTGWFGKVIIPAASTGTVTFYDVATAAGTTSANQIMLGVSNNLNAANTPCSMDVSTRFRYGLVAVVGGTTDFTVVWN